MLGLYKYRSYNVLDLSRGQQQRVAIARSLINNPKIILADELTGNLDLHSSEDVYDIFKQVNKEYGVAFVIVTHDKHLAGRIIEIQDGKILSPRVPLGSGRKGLPFDPSRRSPDLTPG